MAFLYGSCGAARTETVVVGRWPVQLAAVCYWYLPLRICVMCFIASVHSFSMLFSNLVSVNETEWLTIPARPSLISYMLFLNIFLTRTTWKGQGFLQFGSVHVYVPFLCSCGD